jgi:calcineurin-like phosphoesterase family protein
MKILKRKPTFFTSDWHINHANSIKFDNRPFKNTEEMHKSLITNFNKLVPENGITYFLGDVATGPTEIVYDVISQLNGIKVCIVGNHDKNYTAMYNCGFDVVLHNATIKIAGQLVTMSHCPLLGVFREDTFGMLGATKGENWHGEWKNTDFSVENKGQFHLSGHIHSPNGGKSKRILNRQFDIGVPANRYRPVHIGEIESWITKILIQENLTKE